MQGYTVIRCELSSYVAASLYDCGRELRGCEVVMWGEIILWVILWGCSVTVLWVCFSGQWFVRSWHLYSFIRSGSRRSSSSTETSSSDASAAHTHWKETYTLHTKTLRERKHTLHTNTWIENTHTHARILTLSFSLSRHTCTLHTQMQ